MKIKILIPVISIIPVLFFGCSVIGGSVGHIFDGTRMEKITEYELRFRKIKYPKYSEIYLKDGKNILGNIKKAGCINDECVLDVNFDGKDERITTKNIDSIKIEYKKINRLIIGAAIGAVVDVYGILVIYQISTIDQLNLY